MVREGIGRDLSNSVENRDGDVGTELAVDEVVVAEVVRSREVGGVGLCGFGLQSSVGGGFCHLGLG